MCLVAVALGVSERYPLIVAANRDERHARPSAAASWWDESPSVLGGRDLAAGGTWLGVSRVGRLATVTNIFEPGAAARAAPRSRGRLVSRFLASGAAPEEFARDEAPRFPDYGPFNLVLYAGGKLYFTSNRRAPRHLGPGVHVFSNNEPGTDWPKLGIARAAVEAALGVADPEALLFALLAERGATAQDIAAAPPDHGRAGGSAAALPRPARHRAADSIFVIGAEFGTRCSTVVLASREGRWSFAERRFSPAGTPAGETRFSFELDGGRSAS